MAVLSDEQGWRMRAACRGHDAGRFFASGGYDAARRVCEGCTVKEPCLELVIGLRDGDDLIGVFGGMTPLERQEMRRRRAADRSQR